MDSESFIFTLDVILMRKFYHKHLLSLKLCSVAYIKQIMHSSRTKGNFIVLSLIDNVYFLKNQLSILILKWNWYRINGYGILHRKFLPRNFTNSVSIFPFLILYFLLSFVFIVLSLRSKVTIKIQGNFKIYFILYYWIDEIYKCKVAIWEL